MALTDFSPWIFFCCILTEVGVSVGLHKGIQCDLWDYRLIFGHAKKISDETSGLPH